MNDSAQPARVFVLTGFLGAGKTTLLNRILTAEHGRRVAVIVNEFGEVGIDHHLLIAAGEEVVQMNNGCICCTIKGDLVRSLLDLLKRRSAFDTIVIETTGLAVPGPVIQALYADERVRRECALHGVITVVDAKHFGRQIENSCESREQVACADLVLLNKIDLSTPELLDETERLIRKINPLAGIVRTRNSEMDVTEILDLERASLERISEPPVDHDACDHDHDGHGHHHAHAGHGHAHLEDVQTVAIVQPGVLDGLRLSRWFQSVVSDFGPNIMRMKGVLSLWEDPDQFLFQGVHSEFECRPGRPWAADEERLNRLVFIGRGLDELAIRAGFQSCVSTRGGEARVRPDNFGRWNAEVSPLRLDQIRYWMRQNFGYDKDTPIVIKDVPCGKPGCPPVETAILVLLRGEPPRAFKVRASINDLTYDQIYDLMENPMPCC